MENLNIYAEHYFGQSNNIRSVGLISYTIYDPTRYFIIVDIHIDLSDINESLLEIYDIIYHNRFITRRKDIIIVNNEQHLTNYMKPIPKTNTKIGSNNIGILIQRFYNELNNAGIVYQIQHITRENLVDKILAL